MRFLPKANPLYQNIPVAKVVLPDVLNKLGAGSFTGYLHYLVDNFEGYLIFLKGGLISALATEDDKDKTGFEAIVQIFDKAVSLGGEINVYRMTVELAICANALSVGKKLHNGDEVRQVDVKGVLSKVKSDELNAVVRFYTAQRYAMIFYSKGVPIGFYHDTAQEILSSPEESRKVASLPGAKLDLCVTSSIEDLTRSNLLQMLNLNKLWEAALNRKPKNLQINVATQREQNQNIDVAKLKELIDDLKEIAMAYLSKVGGEIVDRTLQGIGGGEKLVDSKVVDRFLAEVRKSATAADPNSKIDEMIDLMQSEIAGRLAV